ncbi:MAG: monomethylamine:corrinoid methyltransferase [Thermodesulfobacteriota bacterium]
MNGGRGWRDSKSYWNILRVTEHAMSLREAARLVGRPGIFFVAVGTAESVGGQIAVSDPTWGIRETDGRLVGSITEFMTNDSMMNKAVHYQQYGSFAGSLTGAIYGGYGGGAEGTALFQTAYHLKGLMVHHCQFQQNFPFHLKYFSNTTRELLWVVSVYFHAVARNSRKLLEKYEDQIPKAPLGKEFQEVYDVGKALPKTEYMDQYKRIKDEIARMGVEFIY